MGHYKVELDLPNVAKGVEYEVPPVGVVENGSSIVVEAEKNPFMVEVVDDETGEVLDTEERLPYGVKVTPTSASSRLESPDLPKTPTVEVTKEGGEGG